MSACLILGRSPNYAFVFNPRFEAAKLVMQWLCNHEDQNMQRMAVAIISILAAKVGRGYRHTVHRLLLCITIFTSANSSLQPPVSFVLPLLPHSFSHSLHLSLFLHLSVPLSVSPPTLQLSTEQTAQLGAELFIVKVRASSAERLVITLVAHGNRKHPEAKHYQTLR